MTATSTADKCEMKRRIFFDDLKTPDQSSSPICDRKDKIDGSRRCAVAGDTVFACFCATGFTCRASKSPTKEFKVVQFSQYKK